MEQSKPKTLTVYGKTISPGDRVGERLQYRVESVRSDTRADLTVDTEVGGDGGLQLVRVDGDWYVAPRCVDPRHVPDIYDVINLALRSAAPTRGRLALVTVAEQAVKNAERELGVDLSRRVEAMAIELTCDELENL